jgi:hypothetical protein
MGEGFDQTTKIPLDSKEDLTAAATYVNKLIEAQRKNPTAGVNPKHLNQMLANLESLAQAQGTSLDSLLKAPQHRKSISDKFPNQQKNISKIFSQIDSGEKIPTSFKEHEELLKTIEDLYASKKLSPDEMSQLDPYYKKLKSSIEKRNAASAAKTDSFLIRKFSNEIADDKYDGTTLYEHLNSIFKHKNSNDISNKDIARLDAHIDSLLENTPIKFSSLNEANDSLQALRKFKSDNKNSLSQKQLALLEERRKYIFEAASKGNNKAAMEGGAKGNEEVASLDPFPPPKKPAAPEAQTEVPASSTAFSVVQKSLGPTNTPATNAPAHLASSTSGSLVPASSVVGPSIEAHKAPTAVANTGKTEKPSSRPITSEEFQRMANGGPNDPLTRAAAQSAVEALRARGAQQTPPAATPAPKSKVKEAAKKLAIATVGTGVALQLMAPSGSENSPAPTPESDDDAAKRHQEGSIPITDVIGDVPLTTNLAGTSPASTTSSPDSPNPTPTVINVPAPANTEGGLPQAPGAPQPDQPSGTPHPEAPAVVPEEPAAPTPPSPTDTPAPTPAPGGQPSPSPSPSGAPSSAPHGNDGTYLPPPPYSPPSSAPSNYSGPPAKKESAVSKFFSAIGNFFSSIFKAILSIFGAK